MHLAAGNKSASDAIHQGAFQNVRGGGGVVLPAGRMLWVCGFGVFRCVIIIFYEYFSSGVSLIRFYMQQYHIIPFKVHLLLLFFLFVCLFVFEGFFTNWQQVNYDRTDYLHLDYI